MGSGGDVALLLRGMDAPAYTLERLMCGYKAEFKSTGRRLLAGPEVETSQRKDFSEVTYVGPICRTFVQPYKAIKTFGNHSQLLCCENCCLFSL